MEETLLWLETATVGTAVTSYVFDISQNDPAWRNQLSLKSGATSGTATIDVVPKGLGVWQSIGITIDFAAQAPVVFYGCYDKVRVTLSGVAVGSSYKMGLAGYGVAGESPPEVVVEAPELPVLIPTEIYLVEAYVGGTDTVPQLLGMGAAWGMDPHSWNMETPTDWYPARTLRFASGRYTTAYGDATLPNIWFDPRMEAPGQVERELPLTPEQNQQILFGLGSVLLANPDGALDTLIDAYPIGGRRISIMAGNEDDPYASFVPVADMVGSHYVATRDSLEMVLRDPVYLLETPVQTSTYGGTGGADGPTELAGALKPLCYGYVRNIRPVAVDPANLIYQAHDGVVSGFTVVYDKGISLPYDTNDYANYAALAGATVAAGQHATCLAEGMFKLGSPPAGIVTCDCHGDNDAGFTGQQDMAGGISRKLLARYSGSVALTIDEASFDAVDTSRAWEIGIYIDREMQIDQAVSLCMRSVGAGWGSDRDGEISALLLALPPDAASVDWIFDESDIIALERVGLPESIYPPNERRRVAYARNWTPGMDLAGGVTAADRAFFDQEYRISQASASAFTRHVDRTDPDPVETLLRNSADANTFVADLILRFGVERPMIELVTKLISIELGQSALVTWDRFGLSGGRPMRVVGVVDNLNEGLSYITLWG